MLKLVSLAVLLVVFVAESSSQRFIQPTYRPSPGGPVIIQPTYRPPPYRPYIRTVRDVNDEPLWLYKGDNIQRAPSSGDHPVLPTYIDDVPLDPNRRYARSVDSPSARRGGGSHSTSSSSRNTGATHPGYNRRNSRSIKPFQPFEPLRPTPTFPRPMDPFRPRFPDTPRNPYPIYARTARDVHISGLPKKPTHRDVIIPNWNPNARIRPWQTIGVKRNRRSVEMLDEQELDSVEY